MNELYHHGILGQKWGIRRYQDYDGRVIQKGTTVKRISYSPGKQDRSYGNRKYVSLTDEDHSKWDEYLGRSVVNRGKPLYTNSYTVKKDLNVMTTQQQGELYAKLLLDTKFKNRSVDDTKYVNERLNMKETDDLSENISRNVAMETDTAKAFIKEAIKNGYGALEDTHGKNVASDPIIVLNPDKNMKISDYKFSDNYNKRYTEYIENLNKKLADGTLSIDDFRKTF